MTTDQNYPRGRLNDDDKGVLRLALGIEAGKVIFFFGKPVNWIGLGKEDVAAMTDMLESYAVAAEESGQPSADFEDTPEPALTIEKNTVRIDFAGFVTHLCMSPAQTRNFIEALRTQAQQLTGAKIAFGPG